MEMSEHIKMAIELYEQKDYEMALPLFEEMAKSGNYESMLYAGHCLDYLDGEGKNNDKSFLYYYKAATEGQLPEAYAMLADSYVYGNGTKACYAEGVRYAKMAIDKLSDENKWKYLAYVALAECYRLGWGTNKNIPLAYQYNLKAEQLHKGSGSEGLEILKQQYPLTENGEIELAARKRSAWATLILWIGIILGSLTALTSWKLGGNISIASLCIFYVITYLLINFWIKLGGLFLKVLIILGSLSYLFLPYLFGEGGPNEFDLCMVTLGGLLLPNVLLYLTLQKRRKGYAIAWNSLMRIPDEGRNNVKKLIDNVMLYGEGPDFLPNSSQTKMVRIILYIGVLISTLACLLASWKVVTTDYSVEIEWNCFNNEDLLLFLSIIGFFLQFLPKMWVHTSYDEVHVYKDEFGNVKKITKNNDVLAVVEGQILMPLICHLLLYPLLWGIVLYYIIMGGFSILQGVMPYVLGLLVLASSFFAYHFANKCLSRKYRMFLIPIILALFTFVYLSMSGLSVNFESANKNAKTQFPKWEKFIKVKSNDVNLRKAPDANSPKLMSQEFEMDSQLLWSDEPKDPNAYSYSPFHLNTGNICPVVSETSEWYKILVPYGGDAYVMKKFCQEVTPEPIEDKSYKYYNIREIKIGKYKGHYVLSYIEYCSGEAEVLLKLGKKVDNAYVFSTSMIVSEAERIEKEPYKFYIHPHFGNTELALPQSCFNDNGVMLDKISDEQIEVWFSTIKNAFSDEANYCYNTSDNEYIYCFDGEIVKF